MKIELCTFVLAIPLCVAGCDDPAQDEAALEQSAEDEAAEEAPPRGPDGVSAEAVDPASGLLCILCLLGGDDPVCGDDGEAYVNSCYAGCAGADVVDEGTYYPDGDGDGFGDADAAPVVACAAPAGTVDNADDCDDGESATAPGQAEAACDGVDNDCDGESACVAASCADIGVEGPEGPDGEYTLYIDGDLERPWTAYCTDLGGEARTFLSLVAVGEDRNFSQYTAGGAASGTDVRTTFTRVRIDAATLRVDIDDLSFASSTGQLTHPGGKPVAAMPYGVAESCNSAPSGRANVDLTGTPFKLADPFCTLGSGAQGGVVFSQDDQVADLTGGGYCGWTSPSCTFGPEDLSNGSILDLAYVGP